MSGPPRPPNAPDVDIAQLMQDDPCAVLKDMRVAYTRLISGNTRSHVSFKDRATQFHKVSPEFLRREIQKLERMCFDPVRNPNPHAQGIRATGRFPGGPAQRHGFGILPNGFPSRYR